MFFLYFWFAEDELNWKCSTESFTRLRAIKGQGPLGLQKTMFPISESKKFCARFEHPVQGEKNIFFLPPHQTGLRGIFLIHNLTPRQGEKN